MDQFVTPRSANQSFLGSSFNEHFNSAPHQLLHLFGAD